MLTASGEFQQLAYQSDDQYVVEVQPVVKAAAITEDKKVYSGEKLSPHGTEVVSEVASAHRGRFALCQTDSGCVAALELPLAEPGYVLAA